MTIVDRLETALMEQYEAHPEWDEAKDVMEGLKVEPFLNVILGLLRAPPITLVEKVAEAITERAGWDNEGASKDAIATIAAYIEKE